MRALLVLLSMILAMPVSAAECKDTKYDGSRFTICEIAADQEVLRLFLNNSDGKAFGHFSAIERHLALQGEALVFGMNAGMYHADRSPVGHYIENGQEFMRVIPNAGPGNFGLLPNGVFCIRPERADVFETQDYLAKEPDCDFATQSGPMLVIDGELHPRFLENSSSRFKRNGVGTSADGKRAVFAISRNAVTFHQFGRLFRDYLSLPNALYFDGNISRLYAPQLERNDSGFAMGPVVGVVRALD